MKKIYLLLVIFVFFYGCSYKIDTANLNIPTHLISSKYSTYNPQEAKITTYFFSNKEGLLHVRDVQTFIPMETTIDLYGPFSSVTIGLNRLTNFQSKTFEDALDTEVAKNFNKKLFKDKNEFIISNDFAFKIRRLIDEYNQKVERAERRDDVLVIPLL